MKMKDCSQIGHEEQLNSVWTIEVLYYAYMLKYNRMEIVIKLLDLHPGIANNIGKLMLTLKTPTKSWANGWTHRFGYEGVNCRDLALERLPSADPQIIQSWIFGVFPLLCSLLM